MSTASPFKYPPARRSDHVDVYQSAKHGQVRVPDPYKWLEDKSEEAEAWIDAESKFTKDYLGGFKDREKLSAALREAYDFAKFSVPSQKADGRWYWSFNAGLDPHGIIYRTLGKELPDFSKPNIEQEVFFDSNLLSDDKTASLQVTAFSDDGKYFAYAVSRSGSDFSTIYVRPTDSPFRAGEDGKAPDFREGQFEDELRFVKFSGISWTPDSKGFFYGRYPERKSHGDATDDKAGTETDEDKWQKVYYHRINTPQSEDVIFYEDLENETYMSHAQVTDDERYLVLTTFRSSAHKYRVWITDFKPDTPMNGKNVRWIKFQDKFEQEWRYIANNGPRFFFQTDQDAPRSRLVSVDITDPSFTLSEVLPQDQEAALTSCSIFANDHMLVQYSRNVKDELYVYKLNNGDTPNAALELVERIAPDWIGTIYGYHARTREQTFVGAMLIGFTSPGIAGHYDATKTVGQRWTKLREHVVDGLKPEEFVAEQVWFASKDGTKIPMFIVRHRDTPLDGTAPAFQYGYGGFNHPVGPRHSTPWLTFAKKYRAVIASVNLRGGSEFGEDWHQSGMLDRKMNVFDDFIAASQWLVQNKYAAPGKVIINGASNGGLLVAACVNLAPEGTFGAAVAEVGVLDMLKYHKFTIGKAWMEEYGDPDKPEDFDFIFPYSPLHNVPKEKQLPALMLMTADHDDRVVPLHSFKAAAEYQHIRADNKQPILIRIERKTGHGAGKSTDQFINDAADRLGFPAHVLGLKWHDD